MKAANEQSLVKLLLQWLRARGICAWRNNNTGLRRKKRDGTEFWAAPAMKGVSDILGIVPMSTDGDGIIGRSLAIEAKVGRNKPTPDQLAFLDMVRRAGGLAIVAYSVDDVEQALAAVER